MASLSRGKAPFSSAWFYCGGKGTENLMFINKQLLFGATDNALRTMVRAFELGFSGNAVLKMYNGESWLTI